MLEENLSRFYIQHFGYIFLIGGFSGAVIYFFFKKKIDFFYSLLMGSVSAQGTSLFFMILFGTDWFVWVIPSITGGLIGPILVNKPNSFNRSLKNKYKEVSYSEKEEKYTKD